MKVLGTHFKFAHVQSSSKFMFSARWLNRQLSPRRWIYRMWQDSSLHNSTLINLLSARDCNWRDRRRVCEHKCISCNSPRQARQDRRRVCEHERRAAEQPATRQAWMNLKNKTHPHPPKYCSVPVFIPRAFSVKRVFALGSFHVEPAWI